MIVLLGIVLLAFFPPLTQTRQVLPQLPIPTELDSADYDATTDFAFNLYREIARNIDGSKNIVFSPMSMYTALSMLKFGAKGNTQIEMERVLLWRRLIKDSKSVNGTSAIQKLMTAVRSFPDGTVGGENFFFIQKYFCFSACKNFRRMLYSIFQTGGLEELDFFSFPERSRKSINSHVEKATEGKIKDLFAEGTLASSTRFVLVNALFFKSKWKFPFKSNGMSRFSAMQNGKIKKKHVPTMFQTARVYSTNIENIATPKKFSFRLLEMPYEDEKLCMLIILPTSPDPAALRHLDEVLSARKLNRMLRDLYKYPREDYDINFPKFNVSTDLALEDALKKLGMRSLFDRAGADFSRITGYRGLYVPGVVHKAFVGVDEKGTEAGAATGIGGDFSLNPTLTMNRPFLYLIRHKPSGLILFMGRVMDPTT